MMAANGRLCTVLLFLALQAALAEAACNTGNWGNCQSATASCCPGSNGEPFTCYTKNQWYAQCLPVGQCASDWDCQWNGELNPQSSPTRTPPPPSTTPSPTTTPTPSPTPVTPPTSGSLIEFKSQGGVLKANGIPFAIKGASWFGFEENTNVLHGLWGSLTINNGLTFLKNNGFNTVRIPLSIDTINSNPRVANNEIATEPQLWGSTSLQMLDAVVAKAAALNLLIMLDNHRLRPSAGIGELWYDGSTSVADVKRAWTTLAERYCGSWNVVAADLKNEPHGQAEWGTGTAKDWRLGAEDLGNHVLSKCPRWLIFVEGVERNIVRDTSSWSGWWGGKLQGVANAPVRLSDNSKLVYSPHVYGPSVFRQSYFSATMSGLEQIWQADFGFVPAQSGRAVVIGEWGGTYTGDDKTWQDKISPWLTSKNIGSFYWCLNPNSGDTGGLLQGDWKTPEAGKLALLAQIPATTVASVLNPTGPTPTPRPTPRPTPAPTPTPTPTTTPEPTPTPCNCCGQCSAEALIRDLGNSDSTQELFGTTASESTQSSAVLGMSGPVVIAIIALLSLLVVVLSLALLVVYRQKIAYMDQALDTKLRMEKKLASDGQPFAPWELAHSLVESGTAQVRITGSVVNDGAV